MLKINDDKSIHINRGDSGTIAISAINDDGTNYEFQPGDLIRLNVMEKGNVSNVVFSKEINVKEASTIVDMFLKSEETKIGDVINKPVTYWYDLEINPDKDSYTIIGYDEDGAKLFILYPESYLIKE